MSSRDDDIVDYLLGELAPDARARVDRAMREDARFRDEVERMRPVVAGLEDLPDGAWGDMPIPAAPPLPPLPSLDQRRAAKRLSLRPTLAIAASFVVVAIGIAFGVALTDRSADAGPTIALARFDDGGPGAAGVARVISADGTLRLQVSGLRPSSRSQFYELWLLDGPGKAVSLGAFRVPESGGANVTVPLPFSVTDFRYIDVSVEPGDGIATHSGSSVLRGPTIT